MSDNGFGSGLTNQQRCCKFQKWYKKWSKTTVLCMDGSKFDSTQHEEIMKEVDIKLFNAFFERHQIDIGEYCDPKDLKNVYITLAQKVTAFTKSTHTRLNYVINGTQPTGGMHTTLGNTSRSLTYIRLAAKLVGLTYADYRMEATGDDTIIFIRADKAQLLIDAAYKYIYVKDPMFDGSFGLGQIAKKFDIYNSVHGVEYLSCFLLENHKDEIAMIRKLDRLFQLTPWTENNLKRKTKEHDQLNKDLLRAEAINMMTQHHNIKLLKEYANLLLRVSNGGVANSADQHKYVDRSDDRNLDMEDAFVDFMYKQYAIDEADINQAITAFKKCKHIYDSFNLDFVDKLEDVRSITDWRLTFEHSTSKGHFSTVKIVDGKLEHNVGGLPFDLTKNC